MKKNEIKLLCVVSNVDIAGTYDLLYSSLQFVSQPSLFVVSESYDVFKKLYVGYKNLYLFIYQSPIQCYYSRVN